MLKFSLYLITDRRIAPDILGAVEEALKGGIRMIQLREKDLRTRPLLELARKMRDLTNRYEAMLFINDRVDIAYLCGADGVHLGQAGVPAYAVKGAEVFKGLMVGVSTHGLAEALRAEEEGADFITLGPVFETPSKLEYGAPIGLEAIWSVKNKVGIPVYAIGGIKAGNAGEVMEAGADGVALISGILGADDIKAEAENYARIIT